MVTHTLWGEVLGGVHTGQSKLFCMGSLVGQNLNFGQSEKKGLSHGQLVLFVSRRRRNN